jgi:hypothetical protein
MKESIVTAVVVTFAATSSFSTAGTPHASDRCR